MDAEALVWLLYTANRRFQNIQMRWQYHYEPAGMEQVQARWAATHAPGSVGVLRSSLEADEASGTIHVERRLWWRKPDCWRGEEQIAGGGKSVSVRCGADWWMLGSTGTLLTSRTRGARGNPPPLEDLIRGVPLLDPSFLLASHDLTPVGETMHAGRAAVRVQATYQKNRDQLHEAFFWATADGYELLVDAEYGILLRYAALLDGREFAVCAVEQVGFDEAIPDAIFSLTSDS